MKQQFTKTKLSVLLSLFSILLFAQNENVKQIDSIEKTFTYKHGTITLSNGVGSINVPNGFKYLDPVQAERVLVELWGNPKSDNLTLGLLLPEKQGVLDQKGYVFNIQYDEIGYVKDDDADDIDYDELLTQMRKDSDEENISREKEGFQAISIVGWAAKPFYDEDRKILHWAKEIKFGTDALNTLNYNVRILGRKGVIVLNAIATESELPLVQRDISKVLDIVQFNKGYKYEEFDSSIDNVAAWTIGGLVAGKILTKVGVFAIIAKFGKVIFLAILGFFGAFKNKLKNLFSKNKKKEELDSPEETPE
ncbi:DUF2167 domain-containing protein [Flavobacterium muglaense]|uniref:DUF2167 domain-containing protein n=1 Tax=Flavobacterium muglaense TaxID=2764716 RepID=A0A923SFM4_9FLAO|nr:DUF2167 domain-containing protein [Flavobacterium muglaense]MBC5838096.1 DUF2167 domain-containing protein [Flavobacterium muglaense]MBC5844600.1 DUF2167 domain-containing protein [Flavobacterium muglaense]